MSNFHAAPFTKWSKSYKFMLEPTLEMSGIMTRLYTKMARENMKMIGDYVEDMSEQLNSFSKIKGPYDIMNVQALWFTHNAPKAYQYSHNIMNIMLESATEYRKWFENQFERYSKEHNQL